jgi:hypothetical protein
LVQHSALQDQRPSSARPAVPPAVAGGAVDLKPDSVIPPSAYQPVPSAYQPVPSAPLSHAADAINGPCTAKRASVYALHHLTIISAVAVADSVCAMDSIPVALSISTDAFVLMYVITSPIAPPQ